MAKILTTLMYQKTATGYQGFVKYFDTTIGVESMYSCQDTNLTNVIEHLNDYLNLESDAQTAMSVGTNFEVEPQ